MNESGLTLNVPLITNSTFVAGAEIPIAKLSLGNKLTFYDFGAGARSGISAEAAGQMYYVQTNSDNTRNFYWMKGGTSTYSSANELMRLHSFTSQLGVNTMGAVNASAQLEVASTTRGFLPPRMTAAQFTAISSKATGLQSYDTDKKHPVYFDGTNVSYDAKVTIGTAAPTTTPTSVGQLFVDTTNKKAYISTGTASSADWTILN